MDSILKGVVASHLAVASGRPNIKYRGVLSIDGAADDVIAVHSFTRSANVAEDCFSTYFVSVAIKTSTYQYMATQGHGNVTYKHIEIMGGRSKKPRMFRGIIQNVSDVTMEGNVTRLDAGDNETISIITLELMDLAAWDLRISQTGGIFNRTDGLSLSRFILESMALKDNYDTANSVAAIQYEKATPRSYHSINIPDGTPFLGVFDYIQNHYGIYDKGVGVFLYNQTWYLSKLWDADKFKTTEDKLVIINVPTEQMAAPDRTYAVDGTTTTVIATGSVKHIDERDTNALNQGTGYRVASVRALELRTSSMEDQNTVSETTPNKFVSETSPVAHRSGAVNAPVVSARFKDDDTSIRSEFIKKGGSLVKLKWEGSVDGLLKPAMGVKLQYSANNRIITRYGTLIGEVFHSSKEGDSLTADHYLSTTELVVWIAH